MSHSWTKVSTCLAPELAWKVLIPASRLVYRRPVQEDHHAAGILFEATGFATITVRQLGSSQSFEFMAPFHTCGSPDLHILTSQDMSVVGLVCLAALTRAKKVCLGPCSIGLVPLGTHSASRVQKKRSSRIAASQCVIALEQKQQIPGKLREFKARLVG